MEDREDYNSTKLANTTYLKKKQLKTPQHKGASLSELSFLHHGKS